MFKIGDKIVYPNQGVGIVDDIEEKEFNGELRTYYKIHLLYNPMTLMLPISKVESSNIRLVSDFKIIESTLNNLNKIMIRGEQLQKFNFKERKEMNLSKVKSGTLVDCLQVICNLTELKSQQVLNSTDRQMLRSTKKILIDEISESKNLQNVDAADMLESFINI